MKKQLLFVDDEPYALEAVRRILHPHRHVWDVAFVTSGEAAWSMLQDGKYDVVVADVAMPGMNGLELLERLVRSDHLRDLPVLMMTGVDGRRVKRQALELGAADLISKPIDPEDLVARLRSTLRMKGYQDELKAHNAALERAVQERTAEINQARLDVIWRLGKAAEYRDNETCNHVIRVAYVSRIIAERMELEREFTETLFVAAPLHDVGKIGIPEAILLKQGPLNDDQWAIMKQHCLIGARILQQESVTETTLTAWWSRGSRTAAPRNPVLRMAAGIALAHHEQWDGGGYPRGLSGQLIPMEARIVTVADTFDALTSRRPYKAPYPEEEALNLLDEMAASRFDPAVYAAFRNSLAEIRSVQKRFADADPAYSTREIYDAADPVC